MTVAHTRQNHEEESEGEIELVPAALRYTGDKSVYNSPALRDQGGLPSLALLQGGPDGNPGPWKLALIPSQYLGWLENHADLEIAYDRETIAEAFLEKNSLAPEVFGPDIVTHVQDRFLDLLGIDQLPRDSAGMREVLADVAGLDVAPGEEAVEEDFDYDLTRSELWAVSKAFDPPFDRNGMMVTEAEEFLLNQDQNAVRRLVRQLNEGVDNPTLEDEGDGDDQEPEAEPEPEPVEEAEPEPEPEEPTAVEDLSEEQRLDDEFTKDELKDELEAAGLKVSGNKDELIARLIDNDAVPGGEN